MKFLKNFSEMFGKILFAKFSSKIVLKVSVVKFVLKNCGKFKRYWGICTKVWDFLEFLWNCYQNVKIFVVIFGRFVGNIS